MNPVQVWEGDGLSPEEREAKLLRESLGLGEGLDNPSIPWFAPAGLNRGVHLSPGVYTREIDLSSIVKPTAEEMSAIIGDHESDGSGTGD